MRIGADCSIDSIPFGSLLKEAVNAPTGPSEGFTIQTMNQGKRPLTRNTEESIPQNKNHRRAFCCMVDKTSALIIALSILLIVSNNTNPATIKLIEIKSMSFI